MNMLSQHVSPTTPMPSRAQRRRLIVSMYVLCPALIGVCWWLHLMIYPAFSFAMIGVVGVLILLWSRLISRQYLTNVPLRLLDERQQAVQSQAYRRAYQILTGLIMVLGLYVGVGSFNAQLFLPRDFPSWLIAFFGLAFLITSLPSAVFAWTEPDLQNEEV
jgi:hypothetical protein